MSSHTALSRGLTSCAAVLLCLSASSIAWADCRPLPASDPSVLTRHLPESCTQAERQAQAVTAAEILAALKAGKGVDLSGVVVVGDLSFDELPEVSLDRAAGIGEAVAAASADLGDASAKGRVIRGPFVIERSRIVGRMATKLSGGSLVVLGPHRLRGSQAEGLQDWSRTVFAGGVDWSGAQFQREALAVRAIFLDAADFSRAQFGPHTRLHRASFHAPVSFEQAQFGGLAEFLEVEYQRTATFAGATFHQGVGFSGSQFHGDVSYANAQFDREAFFSFSRFAQRARFDRVRFGAAAEFMEAQFQGAADFSGAQFHTKPQWTGVVFKGERLLPGAESQGWSQYGIILGSLILVAGLIWVIVRH